MFLPVAASAQITTRTVNDTIYKPDGSVWVGAAVTFRLTSNAYTAEGTIPVRVVNATTDASGRLCVSPCSAPGVVLWTSSAGLTAAQYRVTYPDGQGFTFSLAPGAATTLPALRAAQTPATPSTQSALQVLINDHADDIATASALGHFKVGTGLSINATTGVLSATGGGGGAVSSVAGRTGDVVLTKSDVGLSSVDNTTDAGKPVSTAQQAALDAKQPLDSDLTAVAGLSPTNDDIVQRKSGAWTNRTPAQLKTDLALTKSDVGLSNVDNTSDTSKPVSTAHQAALDLKANDSAVVKLTGGQTVAGVKTFSSDPLIPDEAYDAGGWNGSLEPPTKNAVRDKIESLGAAVPPGSDTHVPFNDGGAYNAEAAFAYIKTTNTLKADVFETNASSDPRIDLPEHPSAPATPASGTTVLYADATGKPFAKTDAGTVYDLTNVGPHITQSGANGDIAGTFSLSAATSATKTFATAYSSAPACVVTPTSDLGSGVRFWVTTSTTGVTANTSASVTADFRYVCIGNPN